jgi:hypothetical protein
MDGYRIIKLKLLPSFPDTDKCRDMEVGLGLAQELKVPGGIPYCQKIKSFID